MAVKKVFESGYRWEPDGKGKPMDIPYEREKLRQFWRLHKDDDFSTDEELTEAYKVFKPKGVERSE